MNARIDGKGKLYCRICNVQVKPADISSWKIHTASRRHQHQASGAKRHRDEPSNDDTSGMSKLSILEEEEDAVAKRPKINTEAATASLLVAGYESDSEMSEARSLIDDSEPEETAGGGRLPAGFFDDGVQPDAVSDDDEGQKALPSGFFDNPDEQLAAETGATPGSHAVVAAEMLDERLAEFESEIAELTNTESNIATGVDLEPGSGEEAVELKELSDIWRQRTDKLFHLRSIIKDGIRDMDLKPAITKDNVDDTNSSSGSSSDSEDFSELTDWRAGGGGGSTLNRNIQ
ncbi:hypothetical protein GGI21_004056 [Coemansia aciculifera]|nr:hypothetical protein GGI21_004056 [Coemansia aciculifera]